MVRIINFRPNVGREPARHRCPHCPRSFATSGALRAHIARLHHHMKVVK